MSDETWIQQSLSRLEALETEQAELEGSGQTERLAEVEEELKALYEVLENAADNADPAGAAVVEAVPAQAALAQVIPAPVAEPKPAAIVSTPMTMADYDEPHIPSGGKGPLLAVAAVLIASVAGGGWYFMGQTNQAEAKPAAPVEAKVISASAVPEDTQEPQVAKGGDATRTQGTHYQEGRKPAPSPRRSYRPRVRRSAPAKKDNGRKLNLGKGGDPLSGVD